MNQKEKNLKQKEYRLRNGNKCTRKYEKTLNGFLVRMYRNMKSRTTGIQKEKSHLYLGKGLLSKEAFYAWAKGNKKFREMFTVWTESGYNRKLVPTVNRIDSKKGYSIDNMEWLTHSENSSLGAKYRNSKEYYGLKQASV